MYVLKAPSYSLYCAITTLIIVTLFHRKRIDIDLIKLTQLQGLKHERMEWVIKCRSCKGNTGGVDANGAST